MEVIENSPLSSGHFLIKFDTGDGAPEPRPGQFYMVSTTDGHDPLLKRPFCYFRGATGTLEVLYRVTGRGTTLLSRIKPGATVDLLGPLGNSWPAPAAKAAPLVIAGGIGIASVFPLITSLRRKPRVMYGGRSPDELLMRPELEAASRVTFCTEDGAVGIKGTVMAALNDIEPTKNNVIYACGPRGMLAAVARWAKEHGVRGYVSLEANMACGVGACLGCVVKTVKGYRGVCSDGPVFRLDEVDWEGFSS